MDKYAAVPDEVLRKKLALEDTLRNLERRDAAKNNFMSFAHHVYDNFIEGRHWQ